MINQKHDEQGEAEVLYLIHAKLPFQFPLLWEPLPDAGGFHRPSYKLQ